jgi:glycosyltransferase involved in cell wall biosynthesis
VRLADGAVRGRWREKSVSRLPSRVEAPGLTGAGGKPTVSVILPTYNRAHTLLRAVDSVLSQDCRDLELIIVDDGSTDGTAELVGRIEDIRVRLFRHDTNRGAAAARNTGIAVSSADWIAFQDSDDVWLPGLLRILTARAIEAPRNTGVVFCAALKTGTPRGERVPKRDLNIVSGDLLPQLVISNPIALPAAIIHRRCIADLGGFDESMRTQEDWEFWLRVAGRYSFEYVNETLVTSPYTPDGVNSASLAVIEAAISHIRVHHSETFLRFPGSIANLEYFLGCVAVHQNQTPAAVKYLRAALSRKPYRLKYAVALVLAIVSPMLFRRLVGFGSGSRR